MSNRPTIAQARQEYQLQYNRGWQEGKLAGKKEAQESHYGEKERAKLQLSLAMAEGLKAMAEGMHSLARCMDEGLTK